MFLPYSFGLNADGSYSFLSNQGHQYLIYFSESVLPDKDGNEHIIYNVGFVRDGRHDCTPFTLRFDGRIRATITYLINDFFSKNDHKALVYFCFGDDGYSRNRNIVFSQWFRDLDSGIEKYNSRIWYEDNYIYGSLIIAGDNPLKPLILNAFDTYIKDLQNKDQ